MNLNERLKAHQFTFKKQFGQNFISDPHLLAKIADVCTWNPGDVVLEIGPGAGTLTHLLAERAEKLLAVEIDTRLQPVLEEHLADCDNVSLFFGDALKSDLDQLITDHCQHTGTYKLVANLPYYITTPLIMHALEDCTRIDDIVIMVQKEVAERLTAKPESKVYGAITVMVQYLCAVEYAFTVHRQAFTPAPDVDSAILHLLPYKEKPYQAKSDELMRQVVRAAFSQRRKTLRNSLSSLAVDKSIITAALEAAGIDGGRRAETLTIEEFVQLSDAFFTQGVLS